MKIRDYINKIVINGKQDDMEELSDMLDDLICDLKEQKPKLYRKYKDELYEMANGKVLTEEMAYNWVNNMKPEGEHWTIEETTNAMKQMGYNLNNIDFYVVANMMYNDYYDLVKEDEELALKLSYMWLNDEDSVKDKLYEYYKHIPKED